MVSATEARSTSHLETVSIVGTSLRFLQAAHMAKRVQQEKSITGSMALFIGIDIADGLIARKFGVDGQKRRAVDAIVDRASIYANFLAVAKRNKRAVPYIVALAGRDLVLAGVSAHQYTKENQIMHGTKLNKLGSLSIAAFGIIAANHDAYTDITGGMMILINGLLTGDYIKNAQTEGGIGEFDESGVMHLPGFIALRGNISNLDKSAILLGND